MRDNLPKKIRKNECGIVNLDTISGAGTHWTAYVKKKQNITYFDSYGNLRPPEELITYFNSDGSFNHTVYNYDALQKFRSHNCGHLCLEFLYKACKFTK